MDARLRGMTMRGGHDEGLASQTVTPAEAGVQAPVLPLEARLRGHDDPSGGVGADLEKALYYCKGGEAAER